MVVGGGGGGAAIVVVVGGTVVVGGAVVVVVGATVVVGASVVVVWRSVVVVTTPSASSDDVETGSLSPESLELAPMPTQRIAPTTAAVAQTRRCSGRATANRVRGTGQA